MNDTTIALVTGANKGIGREIAGQLAALGHSVVLAARSAEQGEAAAAELRETGAEASSVVLDVTDPASVAAAAAAVEARHGRLDVLVNNAGVAGPPGSSLADQRPGSIDLAVLRRIFDTNFFGVLAVTDALLPLLRRSAAPRIVNVSSSTASLTAQTDPAVHAVVYAGLATHELPVVAGYVPSKAALNAATVMYAQQLRREGILVNAVDPGFTATDLNGHTGHRTAAQGAVAAVRMATIGADGPTGTFSGDDGPLPW
ncbi:SDR family NAD(P)-dependent oxidoreductase [uncultured Modestobacter sp.]|uniref:SDR family NAD(P)-dependent oxidoreductase n=1 Tax=uncultured Modestobacter sp. TaxID=380048 RepID=UPI00261961F5|nr:SDR family NAD(P)-dependent oxidoreductase [uncultured Modestobacter sp.]